MHIMPITAIVYISQALVYSCGVQSTVIQCYTCSVSVCEFIMQLPLSNDLVLFTQAVLQGIDIIHGISVYNIYVQGSLFYLFPKKQILLN